MMGDGRWEMEIFIARIDPHRIMKITVYGRIAYAHNEINKNIAFLP